MTAESHVQEGGNSFNVTCFSFFFICFLCGKYQNMLLHLLRWSSGQWCSQHCPGHLLPSSLCQCWRGSGDRSRKRRVNIKFIYWCYEGSDRKAARVLLFVTFLSLNHRADAPLEKSAAGPLLIKTAASQAPLATANTCTYRPHFLPGKMLLTV